MKQRFQQFCGQARQQTGTLFWLTRRNLLLYFKDKMSVFFSMLAPLIILMLYLLFLGDLQVDAVEEALPAFFVQPEKGVRALIDSWMMAGVLSVTCITVAFTANTVMVADRNRGILNDAIASPVSRAMVRAGYFVADFVVTMVVALLVYAICLVYLAAAGEFHLTAGDCFAVVGILALSALSATALSTLVCALFRTEGTLSGFIGILSAAIGFVIGAYMPVSMFPKGVQFFTALLPGSYSAGLMRNVMMGGALDYLVRDVPALYRGALVDELATRYALQVDFFGMKAPVWAMVVALVASIALFMALLLLPERPFDPKKAKWGRKKGGAA